jgi:hypothetical protein
MSVTLDCTSTSFVQCGKTENVFRRWRLWQQGMQRRLAGIWLQSSVKMFSRLIYWKIHFINFVLCNVIFKDNAPIICIALQRAKRFISVNFTLINTTNTSIYRLHMSSIRRVGVAYKNSWTRNICCWWSKQTEWSKAGTGHCGEWQHNYDISKSIQS